MRRGLTALVGWLAASRVALAALAVLAAFYGMEALSLAHVLIGGAVVVAAAVIGRTSTGWTGEAQSTAAPAGARLDADIEAVIGGFPEAVVALDRTGTVIAINAAARDLAPALRVGEPASLALRMPEVVDAIRRAAVTGAPQKTEFSDRVPVDRWFQVHVIPVTLKGLSAKQSPNVILLTFHDFTPIRRVEEMRADFVANASHELRTPLASITGFIETLQGSARDDANARERFLAIMRGQATRMARLIEDLLSLSRVELNQHLRPDAPVDLVAVARQVVDAMQMLARDRGVAIEIDAPPQLVVPGDRDDLVRACENLIENALKYGAAGKRVEIGVRREGAGQGEEAVLSVRDFGPGIAPQHLPRLTERFYRVDVVQSRAEGGTGLGLSLVKHIAARHRGRLTIESTPGQGATFTLRLPVSTG